MRFNETTRLAPAISINESKSQKLIKLLCALAASIVRLHHAPETPQATGLLGHLASRRQPVTPAHAARTADTCAGWHCAATLERSCQESLCQHGRRLAIALLDATKEMLQDFHIGLPLSRDHGAESNGCECQAEGCARRRVSLSTGHSTQCVDQCLPQALRAWSLPAGRILSAHAGSEQEVSRRSCNCYLVIR